jgi:Ribbon-helix-helix protein, copG family
MARKQKVWRFELQLDQEDHEALLALEKKRKLSRADIVRQLIRSATKETK